MTPRDLQRKSPDAAKNGPGHEHGGIDSMPEQTLQPPNLDAVKRMRMEMGTTPIEFAAEHIEDARPELLEAMKCLDDPEHRDLHVRVGRIVNELDDLRALLAERHS